METEVDTLSRAHRLFAGTRTEPALTAAGVRHGELSGTVAGSTNAESNSTVGQGHYHSAAVQSRVTLVSAARTDAAAEALIAGARRDRARAYELTGQVVDAARADAAVVPAAPMAYREAVRRRVARLRAQRAHVLAARGRARRHALALRALRYRNSNRAAPSGAHLPHAGGRAGVAVRAALSRLGRPYVWGATGPDRFDCSGLVQWAYAQAGVHLDRTTYQQIHQGIPVPHSHVRPGDLVFPHPGHVQMAIGNNLVVEAPYPGAVVRISPLGRDVQIRRPF